MATKTIDRDSQKNRAWHAYQWACAEARSVADEAERVLCVREMRLIELGKEPTEAMREERYQATRTIERDYEAAKAAAWAGYQLAVATQDDPEES